MTDPLERRYRVLLRAYPRSHRDRHADEMVGVLLADADPGQHTPGLRGTIDLVRGGLSVRLQRLMGLPGPHWQDALAVVSLILPLYLLTAAGGTAQVVGEYVFYAAGHGIGPAHDLTSVVISVMFPLACVLALVGARRSAAATVILNVAFQDAHHLWVWNLRFAPSITDQIITLLNPPAFFLMVLTAAAFAFSAGPRRGLHVLGRIGSAWLLTIAAISFLSSAVAPPYAQLHHMPGLIEIDSRILTVIWPLALAGLCPGLRSATGRRAATLLTPLLCAVTADSALGGNWNLPLIAALWMTTILSTVLLAVFIHTAETRRQHRRQHPQTS